MSAAANTSAVRLPDQFQGSDTRDTTLLELVGAICDLTSDDSEVIATVLYMINTGRVRLCGNFRRQEHLLV